MDGLASVSGVGTVAGQVSFTASAPPSEQGPLDFTGDIGANALRLVQAAVANTPTGVQQLDVKV